MHLYSNSGSPSQHIACCVEHGFHDEHHIVQAFGKDVRSGTSGLTGMTGQVKLLYWYGRHTVCTLSLFILLLLLYHDDGTSDGPVSLRCSSVKRQTLEQAWYNWIASKFSVLYFCRGSVPVVALGVDDRLFCALDISEQTKLKKRL